MLSSALPKELFDPWPIGSGRATGAAILIAGICRGLYPAQILHLCAAACGALRTRQ